MLCPICSCKPCQTTLTTRACGDCLDAVLKIELAPFNTLPPIYRDTAAMIACSMVLR
jgi:hypothetical protein